MKMVDVWHVIRHGEKPKTYRISFEWHEGNMLRGDHFPERDEAPIINEEEAWNLARLFASKTKGKAVNIYVVGNDWCPVEEYEERILNRYPERKVSMTHMEKMKI